MRLAPLGQNHGSAPAGGESSTHARSLKSTLHLRFELESLKFLLDEECVDDTLMDPMWNDYDKPLILFFIISWSLSCTTSMMRQMKNVESLG
jgi:hypothetical protein